jgi:hypothetical protein
MFIFVRRTLWIVTDAGQGETTAAALARYAIMDDSRSRRGSDLACASVLGPAAGARLEPPGVALPGPAPLVARDVRRAAGPRACASSGADGYWVAGAREAVAKLRPALRPRRPALSTGPPKRRASPPSSRAGAPRSRTSTSRWRSASRAPSITRRAASSARSRSCALRDRGHINWRLVQLEVPGRGRSGPGDALESDVKPQGRPDHERRPAGVRARHAARERPRGRRRARQARRRRPAGARCSRASEAWYCEPMGKT